MPPLALPAGYDPGDDPGGAEAVRLFAARAVKPDFALTPDNAAAVAAICRRLDGLSLAIELAAARARHFPPAALLPRLERRLPLLTGGGRQWREIDVAWPASTCLIRTARFFRPVL